MAILITWQAHAAQSIGSADDKLPFSPVLSPTDGSIRISFLEMHSTIAFEGVEYSIQDAIKLLSGIAFAPDEPVKRRAAALVRLGGPAKHPDAVALVPDAAAVCLNEQDLDLRRASVDFLMRSDDERVPGFLLHVLRTEDDVGLRILAAHGLACWNVNEGVAELIRLGGSAPDMGNGLVRRKGDRSLGHEALIDLQFLNRDKNWGFPSEAVAAELENVAKTDRQHAMQLLAQRWEEWFTTNAERFAEVPPDLRDRWQEWSEVDGEAGPADRDKPALSGEAVSPAEEDRTAHASAREEAVGAQMRTPTMDAVADEDGQQTKPLPGGVWAPADEGPSANEPAGGAKPASTEPAPARDPVEPVADDSDGVRSGPRARRDVSWVYASGFVLGLSVVAGVVLWRSRSR